MDEILWAFIQAIGDVAGESLIKGPGYLVRRLILRWDDSAASSLVKLSP